MPETLDPLNLNPSSTISDAIGGEALEEQAQQQMQEQVSREAQGISMVCRKELGPKRH